MQKNIDRESTLVERIKAFLEVNSLTVRSFENEIGASNGTIHNAIKKGSGINSKWIEAIVDKYRMLSPRWLLTGEGAMMLQERETAREQEQTAEMIQIIHNPKVADPIRDDQTVPLYDLEACAGLRAILDNKRENIIDTIKIPNLPRCDGAVHVVGDSMYPILKSGDIVLYKEVQDVASIFWGEMYLLSMQVDDEEYITVKYIQRSEESKDYIKLVSHNQHHNPKDVPISSIRALALVKASIRLNTIA